MKRVLLVLAVLGIVAAAPATAGAATFKGTVVAKERGKLLVASPTGAVSAVAGRAALGSRVTVTGGSARVVGRATTARVRGIVIRRLGATMYISSNHHVVAVRSAKTRKLSSANDTTPAPGATTPAPATTTPAPGDVVSTTVTVTASGLDEDDSQTVGHAGSVVIQAQIVSVGAGTVTVLVNGVQVPVSLPAGLTLPASLVGQTVSLTLNLDNQNDDNEQDDDQGDDHGDHSGSGGGDDD
jgi:hypothetical protein